MQSILDCILASVTDFFAEVSLLVSEFLKLS